MAKERTEGEVNCDMQSRKIKNMLQALAICVSNFFGKEWIGWCKLSKHSNLDGKSLQRASQRGACASNKKDSKVA